MMRSRILSVGSYVPSRIVTNEELTKYMDTSDEWITQRTGIKERRWVAPNEVTSDLGLNAANIALERSGLQKKDIDLIIFATLSPDHDFPGTGCFMQAKMGLPGVPTLDIRQQCCGFIYGISIADQYIRTGMYRNVLVVGAEVHSRGLEKNNRGRDVAVLFGDGGGAVVLGACEFLNPLMDPGVISTHLHVDGRFADELWARAPGSAAGLENERIDTAMLAEGLHYPRMNGKKVFTWAVKKMSEVVVECLEANHISRDDIGLFLFHQANLRINEAVAQQLELPWERVFNTIQKYGNTTAATLPIGLDKALEEGKLKRGDLVILAAFGSGFTWASALIRY